MSIKLVNMERYQLDHLLYVTENSKSWFGKFDKMYGSDNSKIIKQSEIYIKLLKNELDKRNE